MAEIGYKRKRKLKRLVVRRPYILFCPDYAAIVVEHKNETVCVAIGSPKAIDDWIEETKEIWIKTRDEAMGNLEGELAVEEVRRLIGKRSKT
ncbi:hypothetical protein KA005_46840 [bacterium]|nr:hypothetical protein [bacterium]